MKNESSFARRLRFLEEWRDRDEPPWESLASLLRDDPDADPDNPRVPVVGSEWGRANPGLAAKRISAIEYLGLVPMLERPCAEARVPSALLKWRCRAAN
jgi:hypothetical protein